MYISVRRCLMFKVPRSKREDIDDSFISMMFSTKKKALKSI